MNQLDLSLLLRLFQEEVGISDDFIRLLDNFVDVRCFIQELSIVLLIVFVSLFCEELFTHVGPLVQLFGSQLNIDEIRLLQNLVHFIHLFSL
jgi:hypothetical protein